MSEKLVTVSEYAKLKKLHITTVYLQIRLGKIPKEKIKRKKIKKEIIFIKV